MLEFNYLFIHNSSILILYLIQTNHFKWQHSIWGNFHESFFFQTNEVEIMWTMSHRIHDFEAGTKR